MIRNGLEFQMAIQILLNLEEEELPAIFRDNSKEWCEKMHAVLREDLPAFICKLDQRNLDFLLLYLGEEIGHQLRACRDNDSGYIPGACL